VNTPPAEAALPEIQKNVARMDELQALLYADGKQSLLVVLQALDAAGKDGVVRHLFSGMNPQGTSRLRLQAAECRRGGA
jgi:polyphosphate kinase 2 (PPK2 family)